MHFGISNLKYINICILKYNTELKYICSGMCLGLFFNDGFNFKRE